MSAPRIAIIGMGRMGTELRRLADESGWTVAAEIGSRENEGGRAITADRVAGAEVAIEFTTPGAVVDNVRACSRLSLPVVVGTTGWYDRLTEVSGEVERAGGAMLWAANFAPGINMLWAVAEHAARLARRTRGFAPHILETHHAAKRDAPSGTAVELRRIASAGFGEDIPVTSIRVGSVPGTHELLLDGRFEQLRLEHVTRDRRVFAEGALLAARWLPGRRGVFSMTDVFSDTFPEE